MVDKISIIIPVYNSDKYLEKCINSIINQTFKNFELILINDGSTDSSLDICNKYLKMDNRIKVLNKKNEGVSVARNKGINAATGKYIMFCDSDDFVEEDWCEIHHKYIENIQGELIITGYNVFNYRETVLNKTLKLLDKDKEVIYFDKSEVINIYMTALFNGPCNKIYLRDIIIKNNILFNESISLGEDLLFNLEYIRCMNSKIIVLNKAKYNYILRNTESLDNKYYENLFEIYDELLLNVIKYFKIFGVNEERVNKDVYQSQMKFYIKAIKNTFHPKSKKSLIQKIRYNSSILKNSNFKKCLEVIDESEITKIYLKLLKSGNYSLVYIYEKISELKSSMRNKVK